MLWQLLHKPSPAWCTETEYGYNLPLAFSVIPANPSLPSIFYLGQTAKTLKMLLFSFVISGEGTNCGDGIPGEPNKLPWVQCCFSVGLNNICLSGFG